MPIAHGEGRFTADEETLNRLEGEGRVALRYVNAAGARDAESNPNGSMRAIAGIVSAEGNVLGLMPHPERALESLLGSHDGLGIFQSMLARVSA
jgi:phosphoribosylformylglycinamidine synthase